MFLRNVTRQTSPRNLFLRGTNSANTTTKKPTPTQ